MGGACTRPGGADDSAAPFGSAGGTPARRWSNGSGGSAPASPGAGASAGAVRDYASSDWEMLTDALRLSAAAALAPEVVQARPSRGAAARMRSTPWGGFGAFAAR